MSSLAEQIKTSKKSLKTNTDGILVRTKEGLEYREKIDSDGKLIQEFLGKKSFVPIEGAPDPIPSMIIDKIYLGAFDAATNQLELEKNGITYILNVASGHLENPLSVEFPQKFKFLNVEIMDLDEENIVNRFPKCFDFISEALSQNASILVHCNAGVSRSATVIIGYLIHTHGMSYKDAFSLVKEKRSKINPNSGFVEQLKQYELLHTK